MDVNSAGGGKVDIKRFIGAIDRLFAVNDIAGAEKLVETWKAEADALGDERGKLSIINEELGLSRRTGNKQKALAAVDEADALIKKLDLSEGASGATIYVNLATTLKAFGEAEKALSYYEAAESVYFSLGMDESFEYASLLNNRATAYSELKRYDEAENDFLISIDILKKLETHDGEIAVALINLAHAVYDRNDKDTDRVEKLLDECWEYINSTRQVRDANYAFILSKCAPSLRYFNRFDEADAVEAVAKSIYGK